MPGPGAAGRGLSVAELGAVVGELQALLGSSVVDVAALQTPAGADDLLLVLRSPDPVRKVLLHAALGGLRARLTTTAARFDRGEFASTPAVQVLARELAGAELRQLEQAPGERRCLLRFVTAAGERTLVIELFGARGLWALLDAGGRVTTMSREIDTAVRTVRTGDRYQPPPAGPAGDGDGAPRFPVPVLAAVDDHFTRIDRATATARERESLLHAARRALARTTAKVDGLARQLGDGERPARLRAQADLMLAFAHTVPRGAAAMTVPDPESGAPRTFVLDPARPVVIQAQALYEQARRLVDGRAVAERRLGEATATLAALQRVVGDLETAVDETGDQLAAARAALVGLGALRPAPRPRRAGAVNAARDRGEEFRRFVSAEGYAILVGRDNAQNDRLTMRVANGNDVWLHVGGGRPGSHVIVRLPKHKTASLETLLDAAALAVHFSKARAESRIEVIYTLRKHVRKPKGLPPGAVVPAQTKTIVSVRDEARLRRLLATTPSDGEG